MANRQPEQTHGSRPRFSREQYASMWNASASVREFAKKAGLTVRNATARANYMRSRGVQLKKFSTRSADQQQFDEQLVRIWNESSSPQEAAEKAGYSLEDTSARINYLRSRLELPAKKFRKRPRVLDEQFMSIWNAAASTREVSEKTGYPQMYASGRASRLRSRGLPLKKLPRGRPYAGTTAQRPKKSLPASTAG